MIRGCIITFLSGTINLTDVNRLQHVGITILATKIADEQQ